MDKQPEALRIADELESNANSGAVSHMNVEMESAAELRRQHAELECKDKVIAELAEALSVAKQRLILKGYREDGPTICDIDVALSKAKEQ